MKTFYTADRNVWRKWLAENYDSEKEIYLIFYKKNSGKSRISYNDAVEEALCFGWIDSIAKSIDSEKYAQRFTPRNPKSLYSQMNIERLRKLAKEGKIIPEVLEKVKPLLSREFVFPKDIIAAIKKNKAAWENYLKLPERYKRIRVAFINGSRDSEDEFKKRLNNFIKKTAENKKFGFGGTEEYMED